MDYIEDQIRNRIVNEIRDLELPPEWRPYEVIRYIARMIDRDGINDRQM